MRIATNCAYYHKVCLLVQIGLPELRSAYGLNFASCMIKFRLWAKFAYGQKSRLRQKVCVGAQKVCLGAQKVCLGAHNLTYGLKILLLH